MSLDQYATEISVGQLIKDGQSWSPVSQWEVDGRTFVLYESENEGSFFDAVGKFYYLAEMTYGIGGRVVNPETHADLDHGLFDGIDMWCPRRSDADYESIIFGWLNN